jgi:Mrp family chromosome partitioning ATPase
MTADTVADRAAITDRIVAAHIPGRGLHIVGTSVGGDRGPAQLIELGRDLSAKGRAVLVDLNRSPVGLASLAGPDAEGRGKVMAMHGLAELLSGASTFAEVIHRDQASRLHFIPAGLEEADFRDFDLILDALSETYDFIVLFAPAFPQSEIAKVMAPYADFVVLAGASESATLADLEGELVRAGAREVLRIGAAARGSRQDVA